MVRIRRGTCTKGLASAKVILNFPWGRNSNRVARNPEERSVEKEKSQTKPN